MSATIRVVLVDDQPMIRVGFRYILEAAGDIAVAGEAGDGAEALEVVASVQPDVVLMDVRMPRMDGIEATRRLQGTRVLVLTTFDLDEYVVEALRAGASGFLLKDATAAELVNAVRVVAAGDALLSPSATRRLLDHVVPRLTGTSAVTRSNVLGDLTERERDVFVAMARGLSNTELAQELGVSEATVKTHVSRVLDKLGVRDRVQAVILAYELGVVRSGAG